MKEIDEYETALAAATSALDEATTLGTPRLMREGVLRLVEMEDARLRASVKADYIFATQSMNKWAARLKKEGWAEALMAGREVSG